MNTKQSILLAIATITLILTFTYVPWVTISPMESAEGNWVQTNYERRLFNNPPEDPWGIKAPYIEWRYPLQQAAVIVVVNALLLVLFRTRRKREDRAILTQPASPRAAF